MRTTLIAATCVAFLSVAFALTDLQAEPQAPPRSGAPAVTHGVAVIDVTYIFDNYARLKMNSEAFKKDLQAMTDVFKKQQDAMMKRAEELKAFKPGSEKFRALEEELAKKQSDLKVDASIKEREFAERESKIFLAAYKDVTVAVKNYAERNNISLVLRFNGAPVDQNNRDAVRAELFKSVVYNHEGIDITFPILTELNRNAAVASPAGPGRPTAPQGQRRQ